MTTDAGYRSWSAGAPAAPMRAGAGARLSGLADAGGSIEHGFNMLQRFYLDGIEGNLLVTLRRRDGVTIESGRRNVGCEK